ncbi:aminotransferase class I/II-fold pyridoxal phosphate-dependent enzyme [Plasticicumulans acidivorans]|uniref:dTDP-4-amino-4,6-dideoxygalactose transaminase n=1 Tax=Plasticicumulans acidivorans TaxID=886464 RepID=A0A317MU01_9GAMM|nr:aminotransferase class I/II-fold pyridoxal phosphate-dependent enzyme [Plasticicumulans acidivorans]PWV61120.1 dTDP-4-amino-4,6-dideoxygalactose transaminase [Plasticicumulans acidivorans]
MDHLHLPAAPAAPILGRIPQVLSTDGETTPQSVLEAGDIRLLTSGRLGICHALQLLGVAAGNRVLLPAFHCASMRYPIIWREAEAVYYRLKDDTRIDLDDLRQHLAKGAKAVIATHFFGFAQPIDQVRALCDEYGATLIEDCAHAFFGSWKGSPLGSFGHYAIASPQKFFPIFDGGCLISREHPLGDVVLHEGNTSFQVKALIDPLERAVLYDRLKAVSWILKSLLGIKNIIWRSLKRSARSAQDNAATNIGPSSSGGAAELSIEWLNVRMSRTSRFTLRRCQRTATRIRSARRANYQFFAGAFADQPGCRPLLPSLPDDTVPYVFPLLIDVPEQVFPAIKRARVPVMRWEDLPATALESCPVASRYSNALLQLPCHQSLQPHELKWIVHELCSALNATRTNGATTA